jgi:malate synthase
VKGYNTHSESTATEMSLPTGVHLTSPIPKGAENILSSEALSFLAIIHRTFGERRKELLVNRKKVQAELDNVSQPR